MSERYTLHHGDCLDILPTLEAGSVDAIITDLPYQTTACEWDTIIPFAPMWAEVKRVLKPRGAFVTTASQPFTSKLIMSNLEWFKYEWIWKKSRPSNFLNAKKMPLKMQESVLVFSGSMPTYNPQELRRNPKTNKRSATDNYGVYGVSNFSEFDNYPVDILEFGNVNGTLHPTQKPVALYEYLIRTYTDKGDVVLDFTAGSFTTGVAAMRTGRRFIGIEKDAGYFAIGAERIANAAGEFVTTAKEAEQGKRSLFDWSAD